MPILCNNHSTVVTLSLHSALRRLRLLDLPRTIWIDALCINQACSKEKGHQIPLMRSIYSLASRVVTWLGDVPPDEARETATLIRDLALLKDTLCEEKRKKWLGYVCGSEPIPLAEKLCLNPYFGRLWCIQEVHLAKMVVVYYGAEEITWHDINVPANVFYTRERYALYNTTRHNSQHEYAWAMLMMKVLDRLDSLAFITKYSTFLARDPRDKVYGLLGVLPTSSAILNLQFDYEESVANIYADTIIAVLEATRSLDFLDYVVHPLDYDGGDGFKSWVIRWDDYQGMEWSAYTDDHQGEGFRDSLKRVQAISKNLTIRGLVISTVMDKTAILGGQGSLFSQETSGSSDAQPLRTLWDRAIAHASRTHQSRISALTTLALTLTGGQYRSRSYSSNAWTGPTVEEQSQHLNLFLAFIKGAFAERGIVLEDTSTLWDDQSSTEWRIFRLFFAVGMRTPVRRVFWTANGLLGLGPACMREDDVVVMFYGSLIPHILRPQGEEGKYLYLGTAWIEDLRAGKLEEYICSGKFEEADFCLV